LPASLGGEPNILPEILRIATPAKEEKERRFRRFEPALKAGQGNGKTSLVLAAAKSAQPLRFSRSITV
jgi:hypothetical protein